MGSNVVPSYNEFIDIEELDDDLTQLDFVGIKMGDVNGTCTDCSDAFTSNHDIFVRSSPVQINMVVRENQASFSFDDDISDLEVFMVAVSCPYPPDIMQSHFVNHENNIMIFRDGVLYISYASQRSQGEDFKKNIPFLTLHGDFTNSDLISSRIHNSIVIDNIAFALELNPVQVLTHKIYPNPVSGNFTLTLPTGDIGLNMVFSIFDMFGRLQYEQVLSSQSTALAINLQPGTYYYSVCNDKMNSSGKIIFE
ncbi:MAG: T9SS type A sorting domain-containing protein [Bacteroidota bacterium]|nr:T9SS type A sorting domain-containing protein [Bacteroidota bacterium]